MTAVEFLEQELDKNFEIKGNSFLFDKILKQAKEMENKLTFEEAVKPLMKWLCENTHPHTTAIVDGTLAQLVEGVENVKTNEFLVD